MGIRIKYTPSPRGMAMLAQQAGLGQYDLQQEELDIRRASLAQQRRIAEMQMAGQIGMRREGNQAALQRMQFGAQLGAQRDILQQGRIDQRAGQQQQLQKDLQQNQFEQQDKRAAEAKALWEFKSDAEKKIVLERVGTNIEAINKAEKVGQLSRGNAEAARAQARSREPIAWDKLLNEPPPSQQQMEARV
jgi:glutamate synthase domain-containing protein 2